MQCSPEAALPSLLDWYATADDGQKDRGRRWYAQAQRECRKIARESGYTYRQVAAVLAVTSPDTQLSTNIRWTRDTCLNGGQTAGRYPADQLPKVGAILANRRDPGQYVSGPKVTAFYLAILGDTDCLVVDRWASFAAGGPKDRTVGAKDRRIIADAYHVAAAITGETIRDFQAIVWIACRESTPVLRNGKLTTYRRGDIV
jgi:hypothetical protein